MNYAVCMDFGKIVVMMFIVHPNVACCCAISLCRLVVFMGSCVVTHATFMIVVAFSLSPHVACVCTIFFG